MWTNQRNVSCSLGIRGTTIHVATYEAESFGSLGCTVNTIVTTEITRDSDTKLGMGIYHIQQGITKGVI